MDDWFYYPDLSNISLVVANFAHHDYHNIMQWKYLSKFCKLSNFCQFEIADGFLAVWLRSLFLIELCLRLLGKRTEYNYKYFDTVQYKYINVTIIFIIMKRWKADNKIGKAKNGEKKIAKSVQVFVVRHTIAILSPMNEWVYWIPEYDTIHSTSIPFGSL